MIQGPGQSTGRLGHLRRGLYLDGRFETLDALLDHHDAHFSLGLRTSALNGGRLTPLLRQQLSDRPEASVEGVQAL